MNANTIASVGQQFPTNHPFYVAGLTAAQMATTIIGFSYANTTGVAFLKLPSQAAILGSQTMGDVNVNPALLNSKQPGVSRNASAPYFNSGSFDGKPFVVRAVFSGTWTADPMTASTLVLSLYHGTAAAPGSDILIGNTGAAISAAATKVVSFSAQISALVQWDSVSQQLSGHYQSDIQGMNDATPFKQLVGITVLPNIPAPTAYTGISFLCAATVGTTAADSASVNLTEFSIDRV